MKERRGILGPAGKSAIDRVLERRCGWLENLLTKEAVLQPFHCERSSARL